ncbi:hypothetical protein QVD17_06484 [Tagetes erecta]|uniref:BHLH domain-containing protein n=1 Tax=Tagetes erecta TaxID=13708 RepID=A0AAD8P6I2_TARER|nr:hypothetical protein QVD17_06484 [Tagetes erecta]
MDVPSSWLPELDMQGQGLMNQYQMNKPYYYQMEDFSVDSFSSDHSYTEAPSFIDQSFQTHKFLEESVHIKQQYNYKKCDSINMSCPQKLPPDPPSTFTISFGDIEPKDELVSFNDSHDFSAHGMKKDTAAVRNPIQVQDHVLAERKRREKLAQRFISLSSLLPSPKKMDKASVLEDAANYIQELQNRVKELEGSSGKRSRLSCSDDDGSSSSEANFEECSSPRNPEIQVRASGCRLLVEIYSGKHCISLVKVLSEMHKLGLSVISCSTMPFAETTLVTIVAQKNNEFIMSSADLVKNLQLVA